MIHSKRSWGLGPAAALVFGGLVLGAPAEASAGFSEGLRLCCTSLLPALFPFFVVCNIVTASPAGRTLGAPLRPPARFCGLESGHAPVVLILSWLGGYAVCAQTVGRLRRQGALSEREGALLLVLGCCSGPGFVVGCIGGQLLGSVSLGILLYGLQIAANLLSAIFVLPFLPRRTGEATSAPSEEAGSGGGLSAAIGGAVDSSLGVCGCVLFFRVVYRVLFSFLPSGASTVAPFLSGLLEISAGCADFSVLGGAGALYGVCFCISALGLSVFIQLQSLLDGGGGLRVLALSRLAHLFWMQGLTRLCTHFLPGLLPAYRSLAPRVIPMNRLRPDAAALVFCFLCAVLYKVRQNHYNMNHPVKRRQHRS